eukprot:SAG31_NODE_283_length_18512_cov_19.352414_14_plen_88_part_00
MRVARSLVESCMAFNRSILVRASSAPPAEPPEAPDRTDRRLKLSCSTCLSFLLRARSIVGQQDGVGQLSATAWRAVKDGSRFTGLPV